jgi:transcriptional regulator with XRE-family HTH domain
MGIRTDRLKQLREGIGWTQQELAQKCGITKVQVHRYENGSSVPPADKLKLLAELFNVTSDYLLGLIDNSAPYAIPGKSALSIEEIKILETFRREGWPGVIRLGGERLTK